MSKKVPVRLVAYPFKPARLHDCGGDLSKRWYITFYCWSEETKGLVRKRLYEINNYKTSEARRQYARDEIRQINELLEKGWHIEGEGMQKIESPGIDPGVTAIGAIESALKIKEVENRGATLRQYQYAGRKFTLFLTKAGLHELAIEQVDRPLCFKFRDFLHLNGKKKLAPVSINNLITCMKVLFSTLVLRGVIQVNPFSGIRPLKLVETRTNIAYKDKDLKRLVNHFRENDPMMYRFVMLIFYGFIRPNEIRQLKCGDVHLKDQKIIVPPGVSKGGRAGTVFLPAPLLQTLGEMNLENYPESFYLFSENGLPGDKLQKPHHFIYRFEKARKNLKIPMENTLYSFKHTGVVKLYEKTRDIKAIQMQCRHSSIEMTNRYLKSLGFVENRPVLDHYYEI